METNIPSITVIGAGPLANLTPAEVKDKKKAEVQAKGGVIAFLHKDYAKIPVYGWGAIVAGLGAAFYGYKRFHKKGRR